MSSVSSWNMDKLYDEINKKYDNLTYFDKYSGSLFVIVLVTIVLFILCSYCSAVANAQPIIDDWQNQRCNPSVIPFAGLINAPPDMTAAEFTSQNFAHCTQDILKAGAGEALSPLTKIVDMLMSIMTAVQESINGVREMISKIRTQLQAIVEEIMGRIMNMMVPLQQIIIGFKSAMSKMQASLTAGLFTSLGSYYAIKSLTSVIIKFIIIILVAMVVLIIMLFASFFGIAAAIILTGVFTAFAIPTAIVLNNAIKTLNVDVGMNLPTICFDGATEFAMADGSTKPIRDLQVGDALPGNNRVTGTFVLDATNGVQMYNLNGVVVSESHTVLYNGDWINVASHPDAIRIADYKERFIYCLNTSEKAFGLNGMTFADWDELYGASLHAFKSRHGLTENAEINPFIDGGFQGDELVRLSSGVEKRFKDIAIGDQLEDGSFVYGTVRLGGGMYHLLTDSKSFVVNGVEYYDFNAYVDII